MSRQIVGILYKFDGLTPWTGARLVFTLLTDTAAGADAAWPVWSKTVTAGDDGAIPAETKLDTPPSGSWKYRLKIEENIPLEFYLEQGDGSDLSISDIVTLAGVAGSEAGTPQGEFLNGLYALVAGAADGRLLETASGGLALTDAPLGTAAFADTDAFDAAGAAGAAQTYAVQRANHTGTQLATTISDFATSARAADVWTPATQAAAIYTLTAADAHTTILLSAAEQAVVIPPASSVAFATGTQIILIKSGAGIAAIVPGAGVAYSGPNGLDASAEVVILQKITTDEWIGFIGAGMAYKNYIISAARPGLIGYWPLLESSGATADNYEGTAARDGTYSNVTLADEAMPNGDFVPRFQAASSSFVNIYSADLSGAFNGDSVSIGFWLNVPEAQSASYVFVVGQDDSNKYIGLISAGSLTIAKYCSGGTGADGSRTINLVPYYGQYVHIGITCNGPVMKIFFNGAQYGADVTGLGSYAGALGSTRCVIGATAPTSGFVDDVHIAHFVIWSRVLDDYEWSAMYQNL